MGADAVTDFRWLTPLGVSVALFLLINLLYLMIAVLTPLAFRRAGRRLSASFGLVFSPRTDVAAFGRPANEIIDGVPAALPTKIAVYDIISGMYMAVAILHFYLVWYGLRSGSASSLWFLTLADLAICLYFLVLAVPSYSARVVPLRFADLFPYVLVPAVLLPFAVVLGMIGLS